jgi:hypothetical protein
MRHRNVHWRLTSRHTPWQPLLIYPLSYIHRICNFLKLRFWRCIFAYFDKMEWYQWLDTIFTRKQGCISKGWQRVGWLVKRQWQCPSVRTNTLKIPQRNQTAKSFLNNTKITSHCLFVFKLLLFINLQRWFFTLKKMNELNWIKIMYVAFLKTWRQRALFYLVSTELSKLMVSENGSSYKSYLWFDVTL